MNAPLINARYRKAYKDGDKVLDWTVTVLAVGERVDAAETMVAFRSDKGFDYFSSVEDWNRVGYEAVEVGSGASSRPEGPSSKGKPLAVVEASRPSGD